MDTWLTIGLIIVVAAAAVALWLQWRNATPDERESMIADAVERLVEAAEQLFAMPGSGTTKYGWVMHRLSKRFPDVEWEELAEYVESAVLRLKTRQSITAGHRNGATDRDA